MVNGFVPLAQYRQQVGVLPVAPVLPTNPNSTPIGTVRPIPVPQVVTQPQSPNIPSVPSVPSGIIPVIDEFGYDVFGIGTSIGPDFIGPMPNGSQISQGLGTQIKNNFNLGNIAGGIAGSFAADAFGLSGKYSNITSTIGGAIGSFGGPIGSFAGSFIGSAIGGLFGGKKPNPASTAGSTKGLTKEGAFVDGGKLSSKHTGTEFGAKMRDTVTGFNKALHDITGVDFSWMDFQTGYDVNHGPGFIAVNAGYVKNHETYNPNQVFTFDPNDPKAQQEALRNYGRKVLELNQNLNMTPEQINEAVDKALATSTTTKSSGTPGHIRKEVILPERQVSQKENFDQFLTRYREEYNARAVK